MSNCPSCQRERQEGNAIAPLRRALESDPGPSPAPPPPPPPAEISQTEWRAFWARTPTTTGPSSPASAWAEWSASWPPGTGPPSSPWGSVPLPQDLSLVHSCPGRLLRRAPGPGWWPGLCRVRQLHLLHRVQKADSGAEAGQPRPGYPAPAGPTGAAPPWVPPVPWWWPASYFLVLSCYGLDGGQDIRLFLDPSWPCFMAMTGTHLRP